MEDCVEGIVYLDHFTFTRYLLLSIWLVHESASRKLTKIKRVHVSPKLRWLSDLSIQHASTVMSVYRRTLGIDQWDEDVLENTVRYYPYTTGCVFKRTAVYFGKYLNRSNLIFILGFFVSSVATRWNVSLQNMGFIESLALFVSTYIHGEDEKSRMSRRTIVRNACLAQCLILRDISVRIRKRFPTMDSLVEAGFMTKKELEKFESFEVPYDKYWMPITWSVTHVLNARRSGKVMNDLETSKLVDELKVFRNCLQTLTNYDWVPLPLVYPQLITISVYFYFIICLFARQHFLPVIKNDFESHFDIILPVMTMVEFLFYVGWMKVAMNLLNSFGEDDDDLECNFFIDKNLATGLCIADICRNVVPNLRSPSLDSFSESFEKM